MDLFQAIAMLCHVSIGNGYSDMNYKKSYHSQLVCQASYLECVDRKQIKNKRGLLVSEKEALKSCVMERLKKWR